MARREWDAHEMLRGDEKEMRDLLFVDGDRVGKGIGVAELAPVVVVEAGIGGLQSVLQISERMCYRKTFIINVLHVSCSGALHECLNVVPRFGNIPAAG